MVKPLIESPGEPMGEWGEALDVTGAQRGARVPIPPAGTGIVSTRVASYILQNDAVPWVITCGALVPNGGAVVSLATPAALDITTGWGDVLTKVRVDLPVGGGVIQTPPTGTLIVDALVQAPAAAFDAAWNIYAAPGNTSRAMTPLLTAPFKSLDPAAVATFQRPAAAMAYRLYSPSQDIGAVSVPSSQRTNGGATTLALDCFTATRMFGPAGTLRDLQGFLPLHPLATEVVITNIDAVPVNFAVQWWLNY